jgi:hypothetical protein
VGDPGLWRIPGHLEISTRETSSFWNPKGGTHRGKGVEILAR